MNYKKIIIFIFLIFSIFPFKNIFAQTQIVGIIPSNIWYSKDPFEEGDKIKIYTVVYNSDPRELSGTVIFFDNNIFLGKGDFSIAGKSTNDVSIDWTVTSGDHTIFAKIENAKFLISSGKYEDVYLAENKTADSKSSVTKKELSSLSNNLTDQIANVASSVSDINQNVKNSTPPIVLDTINSTSNLLENLRKNVGNSLENNKTTVQKEINTMSVGLKKVDTNTSNKKNNITKNSAPTNDNDNNIMKPLKYVELFFLTIFAFIFKYKIVFYISILLILFFTIRFIWHLIF